MINAREFRDIPGSKVEVRELRIGNTFEHIQTGEAIVINPTHIDLCHFNPRLFNTIYRPILITPELLEGGGFGRHEGTIEVWYLGEDFELLKNRARDYYVCKTGMESVEHIYGRALHFLHQLQNLFYDLTGTELPNNQK